MTNLKCASCGAELLPETSFCRQCGLPITVVGESESSEQPTAIFAKTESSTTQRLYPRPTSSATTSPEQRQSRRTLVFGAVGLLVIIVAILSAVAMVRLRSHSSAPADSALFYPGAQTVVNLTNEDRSRTIQLQTSDRLDQVESWYKTNLKLNKTVRLTSTSVVLRSEKITITLAAEDDKTNILIKHAP